MGQSGGLLGSFKKILTGCDDQAASPDCAKQLFFVCDMQNCVHTTQLSQMLSLDQC